MWLSAISLALGEEWRGCLAPEHDLMEVLLAVDLFLCLVQKVEHLPDDSLQRSAQVFPTVRLSQRGHVNERRATMAKVQRCVVGEIAQIPVVGEKHNIQRLRFGHLPRNIHQKRSHY